MTSCRVCAEPFDKDRMGQIVCGVRCAAKLPVFDRKKEIAEKKAEKRADRAKRESLKTRTDWIKDAQVAFNKYIRLRDSQRPCICCGKPLGAGEVGGAYDCGHYRSVGSAPHLRFDEDNAHGQRKQCNRYGAGRSVDYRLGLIARRGQAVVERLESNHVYHQWQIDELKAIVKDYRKRTKEMT